MRSLRLRLEGGGFRRRAGCLVAFAALFVEVAYRPPIWLHMVVWLPLAAALCLGLLRPFKGVMIALQFHNNASEHRADG
jgi:uncharacterized protein (DUF983 family)